MPEKKELNIEELENVSGGWQECPDSFVGEHVEMRYLLFGREHTHGGTATHCTVDIYGKGCYYIEFEESRFDGWYLPSDFDRLFYDEDELLNARRTVI